MPLLNVITGQLLFFCSSSGYTINGYYWIKFYKYIQSNIRHKKKLTPKDQQQEDYF